MEMIQLAMLAVVVAILGAGFFWGFIRKLYRTLLRFATLLLALGGAFLLTKLFGGMLGRYIVSMIQPMMGDAVGDIFSNGEMSLIADAICEMIAAPFLFLVLYFVLKIVVWIIYKIFAVSMNIRGPRTCGRLTGALAGLLCGLVGLVVFVTPVFGYLTMVRNVMEKLPVDAEETEEVTLVLDQVLETPVAKQSYQFLGKHMFRSLTTVKFEDDKINLEEEISAIFTIVEDFSVLSNASFEQFGETEAQAITQVATDVGQSKIICAVVASFLSDAAESWLDGKEALGMQKPNLGDKLQGVLDAFLTVFSTSTSTTMPQDLGTFAEVFSILVESEVFTMGTDNADFVTKLVSGENSIVGRLYAALDKNARMAPVKTAIRDTGVRVMMDHLGVPEELRETHSDMLEDMADTLKSSVKPDNTIDQAALSSNIQTVMADYDVQVSQEVSKLVAEAAVEYLTVEEIQTLPPELLADKLAERFIAAGNTIPEIPENITVPQ